MRLPWGLMLLSTALAISLRPMFPDNTDYMIASVVAGGVLGAIMAIVERPYDR